MAQMMRVFIVTPSLSKNFDSTIHIVLQPRVQPNPPPCPIFRPSLDGQIKLTDNTMWVLRLPYIYMGDNEAYYRPKDIDTLNNCRVLKGMFSYIEK
jgi:protein SMG8